MMVRGFFKNLDKLWHFDGVTIMHAIVIMPAVFVLPVWAAVGALFGSGSAVSMPVVLGVVLRLLLGVLLTFLGSYIFHLRYGFDEVQAGLIAKVIFGCIFVLLILQVLGVINLIPG
jgi:hypothetical protein